jgi:hypothetical protein
MKSARVNLLSIKNLPGYQPPHQLRAATLTAQRRRHHLITRQQTKLNSRQKLRFSHYKVSPAHASRRIIAPPNPPLIYGMYPVAFPPSRHGLFHQPPSSLTSHGTNHPPALSPPQTPPPRRRNPPIRASPSPSANYRSPTRPENYSGKLCGHVHPSQCRRRMEETSRD